MAVLEADVVGYSSMVASNAQGVANLLAEAGHTFEEIAAKHQGIVRDRVGDSCLMTFESALDAVNAAIALQERFGDSYNPEDESDQLHFRLGIEMGDVWEDERGQLVGTAVNTAARLESLASPGGVCISQAVRCQVMNYITHEFVDQGEKFLKNIPNPVRLYKAQVYQVTSPATPKVQSPPPRTESFLPRLGREPTGQEWGQFFLQTFRLVRDQFRQNLTTLREQGGGRVNVDLQEIHNKLFICRILIGGEQKAQAKIWLAQNGGSSDEILFSSSEVDARMGGGYDERLRAAEAEDALALRAEVVPRDLTGQHFDTALLPSDTSADYLWWLLVQDLA